MNFIIENRFLMIALAAALCMAVWAVCRFAWLPTGRQVEKIKEWLIWACIEAERELQSGTGQLKLRQVYDAFCAVPAFSSAAKLVSFGRFAEWVSSALTKAKTMLSKNDNLARYVYGDKAGEEVEKLRQQLQGTDTSIS